ncbi:MAG: YgjV family protein [Clostridia bacterium]|nr:YgjV family protein [Clostridia bacterium]
MDTTELVAQIIGFAGLAMNCLSYQLKSKRSLIIAQLFGALFFVVHFGLLGAIMGCMLNLIAAVRSLIFANAERTHANHPAWLALFIAIYIGTYVLTFTVFEEPVTLPNLLLQILPPIAMVFSTVSFRTKNAGTVRKLCLFCSPLWLIYNIFNLSISGILTETISLISIVTGILRLDRKKDPEQ